MAFNSSGKFLDEVDFDDTGKPKPILDGKPKKTPLLHSREKGKIVRKPKAISNAKSNEEPILDFNGNVYHIDFEEHPHAITEHNKM